MLSSSSAGVAVEVLFIVTYPSPAGLLFCGELKAEGIVIDISPLSIFSLAVNVNVKSFPVDPATTEVGVTVHVPEPYKFNANVAGNPIEIISPRITARPILSFFIKRPPYPFIIYKSL